MEIDYLAYFWTSVSVIYVFMQMTLWTFLLNVSLFSVLVWSPKSIQPIDHSQTNDHQIKTVYCYKYFGL